MSNRVYLKHKSRSVRSAFMTSVAAPALILSGGLAVTAPAYAQDTGDVASDDVIVVTGSRLKDPNLAATSPVTTIGSEAINIRGVTDVVDLLNTLPQILTTAASQNTGFANGANGTATVNLRGLGPVRTLVLVDGKRLPYGSPSAVGFASDINLVPAQLVERIEITTGGGSAVYGSDAVAGVANFILKKDFEGFEIDGLFGFNQSGNNSEFAQNALTASGFTPAQGSTTGNETFDISAMMGANIDGGRGNVTAYFRYLHNNGLLQGERDFSQCALIEAPTAAGRTCLGSNQGPFPTTFVVGVQPFLDGSGNPISDLVFDAGGNPILDAMGNQVSQQRNVGLVDAAGNQLVAPTALMVGGIAGFDSLGNPILLPNPSGAFSLQSDNTFASGFTNAFNFNPFNPIRRSVERFNAGFSGHYEINDSINSYMSFGFTQSNSPQIIAPSAAFGSSVNSVNCDNPLLTAEQLANLCGTLLGTGFYERDQDEDGLVQANVRRRFVEGGPRTDDRTLTNFRIVGGFEGTTFDDWDWDLFGQFSATSLSRLQINQVTSIQMTRALDIVDDGTGTPVCRSFLNGTDPACVPFVSAYVFGATNDPGLRAYVDTPTLTQGNIQQTVFGGTIQNSLERYGIQSPWAGNAAHILFGVEYRRDQLSTQADATNASGALIGSGGAVLPTNGKTESWELFMETNIPLIQDMPYVEDLSITGAYRYSNYGSRDIRNNITGGDFSTSSFAAGLSWTPVEDVRIRAQFQRAIRAPNVGDLFLPQNGNLTTLVDPCAGFAGTPPPGQVPTATAAQCANSGVTAAQFGAIPPDSGQLNILIGGNTDLTPEIASTYTLGAIITPSQAPGLTVSLDYFRINMSDVISTVPPSFTLNTCLQTGDPQFCSQISRGTDGSLTELPRTLNNIVATSQNIAGTLTQGIDGRVTYSYDAGKWGSFSWDYNGTYYIENSQLPVPGAGEFDCVGFYDQACGNPTFEYVHNITTTYQTNFDVSLSLVWRYLSGVDRISAIDGNTGALTLFGPGALASETLPAQSYFDVAAFWDIAENVRLRAGVNNLFDTDPPIVPSFGPGSTGGGTAESFGNYDTAGRFIFTGVNIRF
jgi:iron complex outermembrane recepter protein